MNKVKYVLIVLTLAVAACSPPSSETVQSNISTSGVSGDVSALVMAAVPDITILGGELNASGDQYEVTGTLPNGDELEIDMVQADGVWTIIEIQRDIEWSTVPQLVQAAVAAIPNSFEPVRVIESKQAVDGSVVYELFEAFGDGTPYGGPDLEVRWHEGNAELIP
ncbi:MAG: hypothetical protein CMM56_02330 [Rhodospirillaceae bacterium]|nr:hypothetical protein [Rhodospirillaceae bacterium]|tara:strand:- start:257 stop:751 length:495 start_codon:yes stop_codon:yes gene_type:complete